jgi:heterodisulfide reductase subunit B2
MVVNCAACYNRSKSANYEMINSPSVREEVANRLGQPYDGSAAVRHFVEVITKDIGLARLKKKITHPLKGLKVACYYGCYLLRPPEVTGFDDPENPAILENLVAAMGGEPLEWPGKVDCCGGSHNLTRTELTVARSGEIIEMAKAAGADCITVACPMCQTSLDLRQKDIEKAAGKKYGLPILYLTQLLGLCLGISPKELGLDRLMVKPSAVLKAAAV